MIDVAASMRPVTSSRARAHVVPGFLSRSASSLVKHVWAFAPSAIRCAELPAARDSIRVVSLRGRFAGGDATVGRLGHPEVCCERGGLHLKRTCVLRLAGENGDNVFARTVVRTRGRERGRRAQQALPASNLPRGQPVEIPTLVIHHEWICQKYTPMKNYPKRAGNFKIASLLASKVLMRRACERASQGPIEVRRSTRQALPSRDSPSGKVAYIHAPLRVCSI